MITLVQRKRVFEINMAKICLCVPTLSQCPSMRSHVADLKNRPFRFLSDVIYRFYISLVVSFVHDAHDNFNVINKKPWSLMTVQKNVICQPKQQHGKFDFDFKKHLQELFDVSLSLSYLQRQHKASLTRRHPRRSPPCYTTETTDITRGLGNTWWCGNCTCYGRH